MEKIASTENCFMSSAHHSNVDLPTKGFFNAKTGYSAAEECIRVAMQVVYNIMLSQTKQLIT